MWSLIVFLHSAAINFARMDTDTCKRASLPSVSSIINLFLLTKVGVKLFFFRFMAMFFAPWRVTLQFYSFSREWRMKWRLWRKPRRTSCSLWPPYQWTTARNCQRRSENSSRSVRSTAKLVTSMREFSVCSTFWTRFGYIVSAQIHMPRGTAEGTSNLGNWTYI